MTAQADPYVRVYYRIVEDERFQSVYPDDRALATWLRLLIVADGAYPAAASIPRSVNQKSVAKLVEAGLVELVGTDHFRIHGLESERSRRSEMGRRAASMRWQSEGNAPVMRPHPDASSGAMHSAPLRSEPIQSAPLPARGTDPSRMGTETKGPFDVIDGRMVDTTRRTA